MAFIRIVTTAAAPIELCFDLSRDIDLHQRSMSHTGERAVSGRTGGLIELGETVTWEARHLGVRQRFTSKITAFDRPRRFRDEMLAGAFRSFTHDHLFELHGSGTRMTDELDFRSPFGPLGWLFNRIYLTGYLRRLLVERNQVIKKEAERLTRPGS
jgi:ligand-binding SRPBCC domain-containing protein